MEVSERDDGVIELRPHVAVPADQSWFWTKEWQQGEREVDEEIARGETTVHDSLEDLFAHLDELESD